MFIEMHFCGFQGIIVGIKIANIVLQRGYVSLGFRAFDTRYVFNIIMSLSKEITGLVKHRVMAFSQIPS